MPNTKPKSQPHWFSRFGLRLCANYAINLCERRRRKTIGTKEISTKLPISHCVCVESLSLFIRKVPLFFLTRYHFYRKLLEIRISIHYISISLNDSARFTPHHHHKFNPAHAKEKKNWKFDRTFYFFWAIREKNLAARKVPLRLLHLLESKKHLESSERNSVNFSIGFGKETFVTNSRAKKRSRGKKTHAGNKKSMSYIIQQCEHYTYSAVAALKYESERVCLCVWTRLSMWWCGRFIVLLTVVQSSPNETERDE